MRWSESGGGRIAHLIDALALLLYPLGFVYVTAWQSVPLTHSLPLIRTLC